MTIQVDDFLAEAQAIQHVAFYAAEHDRMAAAQAYATIALAQAVIALVERLDAAEAVKAENVKKDDGLPF